MHTSHTLLDLINFLLPGAPDLRCDALDLDLFAATITLVVTSTQASSCCPGCQQPSSRIHSHYTRTVADLPWAECPVRLLLHMRRFVCASAACPRRIFTERLPSLVPPLARRTQRLAARQRANCFPSSVALPSAPLPSSIMCGRTAGTVRFTTLLPTSLQAPLRTDEYVGSVLRAKDRQRCAHTTPRCDGCASCT